MDNCRLCPRNCSARRTADPPGSGYCRMPYYPAVCRAEKHMWEEPCISGDRGSGAVFFCGCSLGCEYCQNAEISRAYKGKMVDARGLCEIFEALEQDGAHNINLVSPTVFSHVIAEALRLKKPSVPVIYNTSGYENVGLLRSLEGLVDVYLPDCKYALPQTAEAYSSAPDYPLRVREALAEMYRQVGAPVLDGDGIIKTGLIVRHLILPGNTENSFAVLDLLADILPRSVFISLMGQYFPTGNETHAELSRRVTESEYNAVFDRMLELGFENGYAQELTSAQECYVPEWNLI